MKRLTLILLCVGALSYPVEAQDYYFGTAAYKRGDYETALQQFLPLAKNGHAKAQFSIGLMYELGGGVPKDYAKAARWYQNSAEQGNIYAQTNLGLLYLYGMGVAKDESRAAAWLTKAAHQGHDEAQNKLGIMYIDGTGAPKNSLSMAYTWFSIAAASGHKRGANNRDFVARWLTPDDWFNVKYIANRYKCIKALLKPATDTFGPNNMAAQKPDLTCLPKGTHEILLETSRYSFFRFYERWVSRLGEFVSRYSDKAKDLLSR